MEEQVDAAVVALGEPRVAVAAFAFDHVAVGLVRIGCVVPRLVAVIVNALAIILVDSLLRSQ